MRVLNNPRQFSNVVSNHLAVPNGFDPPEHTAYRRIIDAYFSAQRMTEFEPVCRSIAAKLIARLPNETEIAAEFADVFAIEAQCAFLDWPEGLHQPLLRWTRKNQAATLSGDRDAMAAVAVEFDSYIRDLLAESRKLAPIRRNDAVTRLLNERIDDRALSDEEIVSILRNWTVGEISTISACVGILAHYVAERPQLQQQLRDQTNLLPAAIDEILRIHPPLISSRRKTTESVEIGGCQLGTGERITIMWASANRDEAEFGDPDEFRLDRGPATNLLYGAGIHVCPGAPLARLELRVVMEELLGRTKSIAMIPDKKPVRAIYPASGFSSLPLRIV
jgi:cytochrome P450